MTGRLWKLAPLALTLLSATVAPRAAAQGSTCKDGTATAAAGRGACSGHGGVDTKATAQAKKAARVARGGPITYQKNSSAAVSCADGSSSAGGRGACSRHGGIAMSAPIPAPAPARPTPAPERAPAPRSAQAAPRTGQTPAGASAQCRDGTYSYSRNRRGTCSHHGGVATWM